MRARAEITGKKIGSPQAQPDEFVPDPQVWEEFGITAMTGWRWDHDPELDFPPAIKIRNRNFRSRRALESFKEKMVRRALAEREQDYAT
jgi:hypothetical protein